MTSLYIHAHVCQFYYCCLFQLSSVLDVHVYMYMYMYMYIHVHAHRETGLLFIKNNLSITLCTFNKLAMALAGLMPLYLDTASIIQVYTCTCACTCTCIYMYMYNVHRNSVRACAFNICCLLVPVYIHVPVIPKVSPLVRYLTFVLVRTQDINFF